MASDSLTLDQASALLDILSHAETYSEIRDFRSPGTLDTYGPPFTAPAGTPSTSPVLQTLVSSFLLTLPGLKDLKTEFWQVQCHTIIDDLQKADLSESYDKGVLGSRKTLATAVSALIEYPVRGTYGGFRKLNDFNRQYNPSKADDLYRAFRDFMNESIYGKILDELVVKAAQTDQLSEQESMVQALHEFVLVNLASFMHYTLILSPKGQYLLKLVDNANRLVPYMVIRQTLKIGNVASMLSAMMKVVLAKMSVSSVTNWMGLTQAADEGMNLMQHIISTVLHWDIKEFESRSSRIERERAAAGKAQLHALKEYVSKSRDDHVRIRQSSEKESISIVTAILNEANISPLLTDLHHKQALEYLGLQLSIYDRKQIIQVLCHSQPDHLTQSVREIVAAYEPVIRNVHNAVDLSDTVWDLENFIRDTIKLSKIHTARDGQTVVPTVGDFVHLLKKHQYSAHKFINQCCKNGKEVTSWYLEWARTAASHFRREQDAESTEMGAGDLTEALNKQFHALPKETQEAILPILDNYTTYIADLHTASSGRLASVLRCPPSTNPAISRIISRHNNALSSLSRSLPGSRSSSPRPSSPERNMPANHLQHQKKESPTSNPNADNTTPPVIEADPGPGAFLARWQDLLDMTLITPLKGDSDGHGGKGAVRRAASLDIIVNDDTNIDDAHAGDDGDDGGDSDPEPQTAAVLVTPEQMSEERRQGHDGGKANGKSATPDVAPVLDAMLKGFRALLAARSCTW